LITFISFLRCCRFLSAFRRFHFHHQRFDYFRFSLIISFSFFDAIIDIMPAAFFSPYYFRADLPLSTPMPLILPR